MKILDTLVDWTYAVSRGSLWVAGAFMIFTVLMIGAEVIVRKMGSGLITGASEISGYMLATCSVWAFSYTLLSRSNIRFDVLYVRCPPKIRAIMDFVGLVALGIFIATVTYHGQAVLATSISFGTRSTSALSVPLWIPQSVWFAGLLFLCWTILILAVRVFVALVQRDLATVTRLAGTAMADDEIKRETGSYEERNSVVQTPIDPER